jgi:hypothetical protein
MVVSPLEGRADVKILLRGLGLLAGVCVAALLAVFVYGRFSDGPVGFFSGGPLEGGELVATPVGDWSFAADVQTIELQLLEPPRSRTVWILVEDGLAYIACGVPNFRLWKQWPHEALKDGRAVVRIDGKRYPLELSKIEEPALRASLLEKATQKYGLPSGGEETAADPDAVWFFRLDWRTS